MCVGEDQATADSRKGATSFFKLMLKTIIILSGIPCSGKSAWVIKFIIRYGIVTVISRDVIRESNNFSKPYRFSKTNENLVTEIFNQQLRNALREPFTKYVILDNTYCKEKYIDEIIKKYNDDRYTVKIKFFDVPLWKVLIRNVVRRITTGNSYKWIPIKIMLDMKRNYDHLNKKKYEQYLVHSAETKI